MNILDNNRIFYEEKYERNTNFANIPDSDSFIYSQVIRQISPYLVPGKKVLDIGCNDGTLSLFMAKKGCDVLGIDLARNAVEGAKKSAKHHNISNVKFEAIDIIEEWKRHEKFDFVLCSHVIEHIQEDSRFLNRIFETMEKGGNLLLFTPSKYSSLVFFSKLFIGRFPHDEKVGHLRRYSFKQINTIIKNAGFEIEKINSLDGILREWFMLFKPFTVFQKILSKRFIRTAFNEIDYLTAQLIFPATICVHCKKPSCLNH